MDALQAARAALPLGSTWLAYGLAPLLFVVGGLAVKGALRLQPEPAVEPWTERARGVFATRILGRTARIAYLVLGAGLGAGVCRSWSTPAAPLAALGSLAGAYFGPLAAAIGYEARIRAVPLRALWRSWLATALTLLFAPFAIVIAFPLSWRPGPAGVVPASLALVAVGAQAWFGVGLSLARSLSLARPGSERALAAVARASAATGISCREVVEFDWSIVNAFALPVARKVAFTTAALGALDDDELSAIAAHELGHLSEPSWLKALRPLAALAAAAMVLLLPPVIVALDAPAVIGVLAALLLFLVVVRRAVRYGERHADAVAKDESGTYARALEKIYRLNLMPAALRRNTGAHDQLYDRLLAAGVTPAWPRPAAPARPRLIARVLALSPALALGIAALALRLDLVSPESSPALALALGDRSGWVPETLALSALQDERVSDAVLLRSASVELEPESPLHAARLATLLALTNRCRDAREHYARAERLAARDSYPALVSELRAVGNIVRYCRD